MEYLDFFERKNDSTLVESIYRSPEWLRKFADFELRTGSDLDKNSKSDWNKRWVKIDDFLFAKFYEDVYPEDFRERYRGMILSSDLRDIRDRYEGDFEILRKFDFWLSEKPKRDRERMDREESDRQERYRRFKEKSDKEKQERDRVLGELNVLYDRVVSDFKSAPYQDKVSTPKIDGETCFIYTFEDGNDLFLKGNTLKYKDSTYTLGAIQRNRFVDLANNLFESKLWKENNRRPSHSWRQKNNNWDSSNHKSQSTYSKPDHPKWSRYQNLKQTVLRREEQLRKMSKNDPERAALENEYQAAKSALDNIKRQYQFENLRTFEEYGRGEKHTDEVDFVEDLFMEYADEWNMRPGRYISDITTQPSGFNADIYNLWYTVYESFDPRIARLYVPSDYYIELKIEAHSWKDDIDKEKLFSDVDKFLERVSKFGFKYVESKTCNRKTFLNKKDGPGEAYGINIRYYLYKD